MLEAASPAGLAQAHRVAALSAVALGRTTEAATHWTDSLCAAARCGQRLEELRTEWAMAEVNG